jgi:tRNA uridine 5-carboxymethylaminomethyl modification enzyme
VNEFLSERGSAKIKTGVRLSELLRRPELDYEGLSVIDKCRPELPRGVRVTAEISIKYEGYIRRELAEVERQKRLEDKRIPEDINYSEILGLRLEAREKLSAIRPMNIGQASRISGVSPADIGVLLIYLSGGKKEPLA